MPEFDLSARVKKDAETSRVSDDRLTAIRDLVKKAREWEQHKSLLETQLKETNIQLQSLYFKELPDAMDEVGISSISLPADGDLPPIEVKAVPYYRANISADWEPDRKSAAFAWLENNGFGDLIKTEVALAFPRGSHEEAALLAAELRERNLNPILKEAVSHQTLTAWLKERVEKHGQIPPLETLGATVGRTVKLKEAK